LILPKTKPESLKYKWASLQGDLAKNSNNWSEIEDKILKEVLYEENPELFENSSEISLLKINSTESTRNLQEFFVNCEENPINLTKEELFDEFLACGEDSKEISLEKTQFSERNSKEFSNIMENHQKKPDFIIKIPKKELILTKNNAENVDNFPKKVIKWSFIAMKMNQRANLMKLTGQKLGKHCRERWLNHLSPKLLKRENGRKLPDISQEEHNIALKTDI